MDERGGGAGERSLGAYATSTNSGAMQRVGACCVHIKYVTAMAIYKRHGEVRLARAGRPIRARDGRA